MMRRSVLRRRLAEVGEPGVGAFHRPAEAEGDEPLVAALAVGTAAGDDKVGKSPLPALVADEGVVVAPVQVQGFNLCE